MENICCKKIMAIFQDDKIFLGGPKNLQFCIDDHISIEIEQIGIRVITIEAEREETFDRMYGIFSRIERLLMFLDGKFITLKKISFEASDKDTEEHLNLHAADIMKRRLAYYGSADFCSYSLDKLVDYESVITSKLFDDWQLLLEELDVVHQIFLYSVSACEMPVDVKCAFLIELAEPLIEIVNIHTNLCELKLGKNNPPLKLCVNVLIQKYGTDIFDKEIASNYSKFLQVIVNSRVRIMHIKRKQKGLFFNGDESILYAKKMTLLYRKIMFEMLGIPENLYIERLRLLVEHLNKWNNIHEKFLTKLS